MGRRLVKKVIEARNKALAHLDPGLLEKIALDPEHVAAARKKEAQTHLRSCQRCQTIVEDTAAKRDFFKRQTRKDCQ